MSAWKRIPSAPDYAASRTGLIARVSPARTRSTPYVLKGSFGKNKKPYRVVKIVVDGAKETRPVHQLVCEAFHGRKPFPEWQCCHNNGNPLDNRPSNLRWDSCKGNQADRKIHGTTLDGDKNGRAKLTWEEVEKIRKSFTGKHGDYMRLSREFNIADSQIHEIIKKKSWWPVPKTAWECVRT